MTSIYNITCAGVPLPLLALYFLWYSFLGWCMETVYCSIAERRFVFRGFLKGPICPIYGFGVMVMVLWLQQFTCPTSSPPSPCPPGSISWAGCWK